MNKSTKIKFAVAAIGELVVILAGLAVYMTMDARLGFGIIIVGSAIATGAMVALILGSRQGR